MSKLKDLRKERAEADFIANAMMQIPLEKRPPDYWIKFHKLLSSITLINSRIYNEESKIMEGIIFN